MEDERRPAAAKEAATRRVTESQVLQDGERLIDAWNARQGKRMPTLFSPTIGAPLPFGDWFLCSCPFPSKKKPLRMWGFLFEYGRNRL
jgi:hypothetical protein